MADLPQPGPVAAGVGNLHRVEPVEGNGTQPGEAHAGRVRLGQRPGDHLEQRLQRRGPEAAAKIAKSLLRRGSQVQPGQSGGELPPDPQVTQMREHAEGQYEVDAGPRRLIPQPPLHGPGLSQHIVDQLERQVPG